MCADCVPCCPLASTPNWCRMDYPTANYLHPSLTSRPPSLPFVSFLPSFLSLPAFLFPSPPPQITAVFTRALRDLPTRPRVRSHSPRRAKKNPPKSYQASCLLTHWLPECVDNVFCVRVGACCVSRRPTAILLLAQNPLVPLLRSPYRVSFSVSFHLVSLVWSVTDLLARLYC